MAPPAPADIRGQKLTDQQIAGWAKNAGFPREELATAVAVALAESDGRIDAVGDGGNSYGVWQIHEPSNPHVFQNESSANQWWTATNAKMAFQVWTEWRARGKYGWSAWSTFNNGAYLLYMPRARVAAAFWPDTPGTVGEGETPTHEVFKPPDAMVEIGNAIKGIAQGVSKVGSWLGDSGNIIRAAQVAVGGAMIVGALAIVVKPVVAPVVDAAKKLK